MLGGRCSWGDACMANVSVRHAEPDDAQAIHRILSGPQAIAGTMQLPLQSLEGVRKRFFSESREDLYHLVACVDEEVVGHLGLETFTRPRRRHVGQIGMAVRDDWHGKGAGTALMQAMIELADKWLSLTRIELEVYTDNEPAIRLYKKFDFVIEGTHVNFAYRDGNYVDAHF